MGELLRRSAMMAANGGDEDALVLYDSGVFQNGLTGMQLKGYRAVTYGTFVFVANPQDLYFYMKSNVQATHTISSKNAVNLSGKTKLHILGDWTSNSETRGRYRFGLASSITDSNSINTALPNRVEKAINPVPTSDPLSIDISSFSSLGAAYIFICLDASQTNKMSVTVHKIWAT